MNYIVTGIHIICYIRKIETRKVSRKEKNWEQKMV